MDDEQAASALSEDAEPTPPPTQQPAAWSSPSAGEPGDTAWLAAPSAQAPGPSAQAPGPSAPNPYAAPAAPAFSQPPTYQGDPRFGTPPAQPPSVPATAAAVPGPSGERAPMPQDAYYQPSQAAQPSQTVQPYQAAQPYPAAQPYQAAQLYQAAPGYPVATMVPAGPPKSISGLSTAMLVLGAILVFSDVLRALTSFSAEHAYQRAMQLGYGSPVSGGYLLASVLGDVALPLYIVGSFWLMHARQNAATIAPHRMRRSAIWCWFGWITPVVACWFPKQIIDDTWNVTADAGGVSAVSKPRTTGLMWGLWVAYWAMYWITTFSTVSSGSLAQQNQFNYQNGQSVHESGYGFSAYAQHVHPVMELLLAAVAIAAFAAWVPVVRGVTSAQENVRARFFGTQSGGAGFNQF